MTSFDTSFVFTPGKLTITLDGGAGSSGKGKLGSFLCEHAANWQFACNTFMPQAAHWVRLDNGESHLYQTFNSCAYLADRYDKLFIAPGAAIELDTFQREVEENGIPRNKIGISPITAILQGIDGDFEKGKRNLDGNVIKRKGPGYLAKTGTTAKGCGVNRARRLIRHPKARYAKDVPELKAFLCDVPEEIMRRLDAGQSGLFEIAQGFQLSYLLKKFYPFTTSRNCTVAAGLDDLMLPPCYAGNVVLNFRTYPIRINSNKYVDKATGDHLPADEVYNRTGKSLGTVTSEELESAGIEFFEGDSGPGYDDQDEVTWEYVTKNSGSPKLIEEETSVTRLPRRVFSFSKENVEHAIRHNRTEHELFLSLAFADYIDYKLLGHRDRRPEGDVEQESLDRWLQDNLGHLRQYLRFIGTGPKSKDMIQLC